jgi:hypothetical protein
MSKFEHDALLTVGFSYHPEKGLCFPDGTSVRPKAMERLRHWAGRLNNLAYMANAMDLYDGVENPAPAVSGGKSQFDHLLEMFPAAALIYFALRRLQRAGHLVALRQGLNVLIAFDHDEMTASDAVSALWPVGAEHPAALAALPAPQALLQAA